MRQVPENKAPFRPSYTLIGAGRLARHLRHYFALSNISLKTWSRSTNTEKELEALSPVTSHFLLAISDSSIEPFVKDRPWLSHKTLIHFSGVLSTPLAESAHPLMAFADELYDLDTYKKIPFVLEKERTGFSQLFPDFSNPSFEIDSQLKPLYHSLCVAGGNFTHFLWLEVFQQAQEKLGLPREVFLPYMQQVFQNLKDNPDQSATGPLVRKDLQTIQSHLRAIEPLPLAKVYRSFLDLKGIQP